MARKSIKKIGIHYIGAAVFLSLLSVSITALKYLQQKMHIFYGVQKTERSIQTDLLIAEKNYAATKKQLFECQEKIPILFNKNLLSGKRGWYFISRIREKESRLESLIYREAFAYLKNRSTAFLQQSQISDTASLPIKANDLLALWWQISINFSTIKIYQSLIENKNQINTQDELDKMYPLFEEIEDYFIEKIKLSEAQMSSNSSPIELSFHRTAQMDLLDKQESVIRGSTIGLTQQLTRLRHFDYT